MCIIILNVIFHSILMHLYFGCDLYLTSDVEVHLWHCAALHEVWQPVSWHLTDLKCDFSWPWLNCDNVLFLLLSHPPGYALSLPYTLTWSFPRVLRSCCSVYNCFSLQSVLCPFLLILIFSAHPSCLVGLKWPRVFQFLSLNHKPLWASWHPQPKTPTTDHFQMLLYVYIWSSLPKQMVC